MLSPIVTRLAAQQQHRVCLWWGGLGAYYLYQFLNISLAKASSGKNITPVCTTLSVCILIEQSRGSPESKECLGINIQDQGWVVLPIIMSLPTYVELGCDNCSF